MPSAPIADSLHTMPRPRPADAAIAAALAIAAQLEVWLGGWWRGPEPVDALVASAAPLLLAYARHAPLRVLLAAGALYTADSLAFGAPGSITQPFTMFSALLACSAFGDDRRWWAIPASAAGLAVANLTDPDPVEPGQWVFPLFFYGIAWLVGGAIRRRDEQAAQLEREQESVARAAVLDERVRIARELHDVVAHGISVMVVQAVGGRAALGQPDHPSSGAFDAIETTGKQSLAEMRRLLGVLRAVDGDAMLVPQPGLRELEPLIERAREAGLAVSLQVDGAVRDLPAGVDLSAYRVLQEALTNVIKHAGAASVEVNVGYEPNAIRLAVRDDGTSPANGNGAAAGHGLAGMRERVELFGGDFAAGPAPGGGYAVTVRLPVEAA
jgi:signal transduction histidine kinase